MMLKVTTTSSQILLVYSPETATQLTTGWSGGIRLGHGIVYVEAYRIYFCESYVFVVRFL